MPFLWGLPWTAPPGAGHQALGVRLVGGICFHEWGFLEWQGSRQAFPWKFNLASVIFPSWCSTSVNNSSVWHMLEHHALQKWAMKVPFLIFSMDDCSRFLKRERCYERWSIKKLQHLANHLFHKASSVHVLYLNAGQVIAGSISVMLNHFHAEVFYYSTAYKTQNMIKLINNRWDL